MLGIMPLWVYAQSRLDSIQHLDEITVVAKSFREVIPSQKIVRQRTSKIEQSQCRRCPSLFFRGTIERLWRCRRYKNSEYP